MEPNIRFVQITAAQGQSESVELYGLTAEGEVYEYTFTIKNKMQWRKLRMEVED